MPWLGHCASSLAARSGPRISAKSSQKTQAWRFDRLSGRCDCETQLQIAQRAVVVVWKSPAAVARTGHRSRGRRIVKNGT